MKKMLSTFVTCVATIVSAGTLSASATNPNKIDAGFYPEGTELFISATGTVVLCWEYMCRPDGSLAAPMASQDTARLHAVAGSENYPATYGGDGANHFEGGGLNYVPGHGDIGWPIAGKHTTDTRDNAAIRFGALVGTFSDAPAHGDWFCIGFGKKVTVPHGGAHLYLLVNDSWYADNSGGYWVTIEKGHPATVQSQNSRATVPVTASVYAQSFKAATLPRDNVFGHALPAGIGLTHQIEASLDLVHWSPATNVIFYFKDLDSPNFSSRFYRFLELK